MPARLTIYRKDQPALQFSLDPKRKNLIGRGPDCDLRIEDPRLSRHHARLTAEGERWKIGDLGSKNGTTLAGGTVGETPLSDGDWISFGGLLGQFTLLSDEQLAAEALRARTRWEDTIVRSRRLDPAAGVEVLLQQLLQASLELAGAERGFVMLVDEAGQLTVRVTAGNSMHSRLDFPGSRSVLARAIETLAAVVVCDVRTDTLLGLRPSILAGQIRAVVCLPLAIGEQLNGLVYLDSAVPGKVFNRLDLEILEAFAAHAALVIGAAMVRTDLAGIAELLPRELSRGPLPGALLQRLKAALPRPAAVAVPDWDAG